MEKGAKIYVAGHTGMVGSSILRELKSQGYTNFVTRTHSDLDLTNQSAVDNFFETERPEYVFLAAAKVGGIKANSVYRAEFIRVNLAIELNVIEAAHKYGVRKLLFLGSSCIYPKLAPQPLKEEYLLSGPLEPTNEPYAIAKIAGIKMCEAYWDQYGDKFVSVMPTNLYGPNDNYDLETSHVLPALIHKFHLAKEKGVKEVVVWGSGKPKREFMYVDDMAAATVLVMRKYDEREFINIGTGEDISIAELAELVKDVVGFEGGIVYDRTKPDGTPRKLLDVSKLRRLGFEPKYSLRDGVRQAYDDFLRWYGERHL